MLYTAMTDGLSSTSIELGWYLIQYSLGAYYSYQFCITANTHSFYMLLRSVLHLHIPGIPLLLWPQKHIGHLYIEIKYPISFWHQQSVLGQTVKSCMWPMAATINTSIPIQLNSFLLVWESDTI